MTTHCKYTQQYDHTASQKPVYSQVAINLTVILLILAVIWQPHCLVNICQENENHNVPNIIFYFNPLLFINSYTNKQSTVLKKNIVAWENFTVVLSNVEPQKLPLPRSFCLPCFAIVSMKGLLATLRIFVHVRCSQHFLEKHFLETSSTSQFHRQSD